MTAITEMVAAEKKSAEKIDETTPDETLKRIPNKSLAEFKRDTNMENVLIKGRLAVRGGISMHVPTTGTGKSVLQTMARLIGCVSCPRRGSGSTVIPWLRRSCFFGPCVRQKTSSISFGKMRRPLAFWA